ncbi:protein odr-4 homolog isoform X2 [Cucurbita pepo subsp. pepo]|uniref:protein odr-4 homolog isoform X2 n=1 Tax=Cucurbita pepo subsp. pepo TaxID=3664 RepID=UPI000C9D8242|nr:protein odr-4 homolog isoform X2 [Cucurbita pepo subsp. pepo]
MMVKAVVAEESRLTIVEDRLAQSAIPSEIGLVIGRLSSPLDRGFVFDLIPTPPNDAGEAACSLVGAIKDDKKKGSKGKSPAVDSSSLVIDKDWVAEHARQVRRMLPGGVKVIGVYVWASETAVKNSTLMLCQAVKAVAEAAPLSVIDSEARLLVHICYSPRRWTCRNFFLTSNLTSNSLRPCDFKMGRVLTSLQTYKCIYNFDMRLPVSRASNVQKLIDVIRNGISIQADVLKDAKAMIDGNLVVSAPSTLGDLHEIELLLPFLKDTSLEACRQKEVDGIVVFRGSVCSFAYLNSKEPVSEAVTEIKGDIITSLQSRLDIICDEVDADKEAQDVHEDANEVASEHVSQLFLHSLRKQCNLSFPRRVFVPWLADIYICDYLQPSETTVVLKEHCTELMSMEASMDMTTVLEPEKEALSLSAESFWDVAVPFQCAETSLEKKNRDDDTRTSSNATSSSKSSDFALYRWMAVISKTFQKLK